MYMYLFNITTRQHKDFTKLALFAIYSDSKKGAGLVLRVDLFLEIMVHSYQSDEFPKSD